MNDKKCCVCGDRAVGNNFNALTCESCRSFFRRNAFRVEEFHCFFDNNCSINWLTRKFCKTCRLKKCFAVGMKKELIFVEKKSKKRKRLNKSQLSVDLDNNCQNIVDTTVSNERQKVSDIPTLIRELIFSFNELEMNRFRELFSSAVMLRDPVLKTISETNTYMDSFTVLQKRAALKCNRIIKMSTNISEFTNLCEEDKIALLKTGCPEVICLLTVVNFDFNDNYWTVPVDDYSSTRIPLSVLKYGKGGLYEEHLKFMNSVKEEYNCDLNLIDLMIAILLFNPNVENLKHKNLVKLQQQTYMFLLQRYLELKHNSKCESETRFVRLMNNIQHLYAVNRIHLANYSGAEPKIKGGIVEEIYD